MVRVPEAEAKVILRKAPVFRGVSVTVTCAKAGDISEIKEGTEIESGTLKKKGDSLTAKFPNDIYIKVSTSVGLGLIASETGTYVPLGPGTSAKQATLLYRADIMNVEPAKRGE